MQQRDNVAVHGGDRSDCCIWQRFQSCQPHATCTILYRKQANIHYISPFVNCHCCIFNQKRSMGHDDVRLAIMLRWPPLKKTMELGAIWLLPMTVFVCITFVPWWTRVDRGSQLWPTFFSSPPPLNSVCYIWTNAHRAFRDSEKLKPQNKFTKLKRTQMKSSSFSAKILITPFANIKYIVPKI